MPDICLNVTEPDVSSGEALVDVVLTRDGDEVLHRPVRLFDNQDVAAVVSEVVDKGGVSSVDVKQALAERLQPFRMDVLAERNRGVDKEHGEEEPERGENQDLGPRYVAVLPGEDGVGPRETGIRDLNRNRLLANFAIILQEDVEVQDDFKSQREFAGKLYLFDKQYTFRIAAADFSDNGKLRAVITEVGGCEAMIHCPMDELRRAISDITIQSGTICKRRSTTNFGWTTDRKEFLTPSVRITNTGVEELTEEAELRVNIPTAQLASHLDLKKLDDIELKRVKRQIVQDLLKLSVSSVTYTMLGASAAAVLYPFARGAGRFALWLVGRTGAGKSHLAKLFMNFFGEFPTATGPFANWSSTANAIQQQGYFFKDSLYLVDDYKPEVVPAYQIVRILQTYADNTARERLKADATANVSRPIRGILVCTGEDVPEHNASASARSVIVQVPNPLKKKVSEGVRCEEECQNYPGVTAAFIHWLLEEERIEIFKSRFAELRARYEADVAGQQNDLRVAINIALLGAAFEQFAEFLSDVWPEWREESRQFVERDLVAIRNSMLGEAKDQQSSEIFLSTLADLISHHYVQIEGYSDHGEAQHKPNVGRALPARGQEMDGVARAAAMLAPGQQVNSVAPGMGMFQINTSLALAQVNNLLRQQGRPELKITVRSLLQQLREDGKLIDENGGLAGPESEVRQRVRLGGKNPVHVFTISRQELVGV